MTRGDTKAEADRLVHRLPRSLRGRWDDGRVPEEDIVEAFEPSVNKILYAHERNTSHVSVQGPVSSGKTWLIACAADALKDAGNGVLVLAPQKQNRDDIVKRLSSLDTNVIEHPGEADLCVWDDWKTASGYTDHQACSGNGCPYFPDDFDKMHLQADEALETVREISQSGASATIDQTDIEQFAESSGGVCPRYFRLALRNQMDTDAFVGVATHAKALVGAAPTAGQDDESKKGPFEADVVLVDEAHQVAADTGRVSNAVAPSVVADSLRELVNEVSGSESLETEQHRATAQQLANGLDGWDELSRKESVKIADLRDRIPTLPECEESVGHLEEELLWSFKTGQGSEGRDDLVAAYNASRSAGEFLSLLRNFENGDLDFVHARYEEQGQQVVRLMFRRVDSQPQPDACAPSDVYRAWQDQGTHPAIEKRWDGLLESHIESYWTNRGVSPGGDHDTPRPPRRPLDALREETGAQMVCTVSATHNEMSDPTRPAHDMRETRHDIVVAEPNLRTDGSGDETVTGSMSVEPSTPWFQEVVEEAQQSTDADLAAVPINSRNAEKWRNLPVRTLPVPDGSGNEKDAAGLVPHGRGAVGSKDFEDLPVDAVLCGLQAQPPADTARRVVEWWDLLAARRNDPEAVLAESWRLLAQHLVSGTIQAAGRFRPEATTILFDLPELVELAGYEYETAVHSLDGFAGAFATKFEQRKEEDETRQAVFWAMHTVEWLEQTDSKSPSENQVLSTYVQAYDVTEEEAEDALEAALQAEKLSYNNGFFRTSEDNR